MNRILYTDPYDSSKYISETDECIIAVGGDGTLLRAVNLYREKDKPFFGVARGTRNFLMNHEPDVFDDATTLLCNLIEVTVFDADSHNPTSAYAFNDVVIGQFNSWCEFITEDSDMQIGNFNASGMIISTPAGSTGVNRNNGGTILPLTANTWSVTGMQSNRTVNTVVAAEQIIINMKSRTSMSAALDGINKIFDNVGKVVLRRGPTVRILINDIKNFQQKRQ
jgi:NAD+ kinase